MEREQEKNLALMTTVILLLSVAFTLTIYYINDVKAKNVITNESYTKDNYADIIKDLQANADNVVLASKTEPVSVANVKGEQIVAREKTKAERGIETLVSLEEQEKIHKQMQQGEQESFDEQLINFVTKWEGNFQAKAFCDDYYKTTTKLIRKLPADCGKWTIWFWTNSYQGEVISYEEAIKRRDEAILWRKALISSNCISDKARIIAIDFIYQYSSKYANQMKYYANTCQENKIVGYIVEHRDFYRGKEQSWLVKREQARINLYYNNN